ncbi:MAG: plasmid pRiA4b ORF-3 family protein [Xanthomonadales bacterium]|nr:plasmid pRiA4b ORF-3 family protein [Xanthomonadales bacterium]
MFVIFTSGTLSRDVSATAEAKSASADAINWYGHRVTIEHRKCVVLMEAATRYGVLMPGLTKPDFKRLGDRLRERLPQELAWIHGGDREIAERFRPAVERLAEPVIIAPGSDRSVQAHINDFVHNVRDWVHRNDRLPRDDEESFRAAQIANWMIKMGKAHPKGMRSAPAFREQWLELAGIDADSLPEPIDPIGTFWARYLPRRDTGTFQLKIELLGAEPPIWRRLRVPSNLPLLGLHDVIQVAMGWWNSHLHEFSDGRRRYGQPHGEWPDEALSDEGEFGLDQLLSRTGDRLEYLYDFGDGWEHLLTLEAVDPPGAHARRLECLDGMRQCPPEDVGGLSGYMEFLEAVRNRSHPEHAEMLQWAGGEFDPEEFDADQINAELAEEFPPIPSPPPPDSNPQ